MPNVKEGSVIEFEYTIKSPRFSELIDLSFQSSIPVNYSEFRTYIPEYFVYTRIKRVCFPRVSSEKNKRTIVRNSKERAGIVGNTTFLKIRLIIKKR
jgi:hypothetical protein